MHRSPLPRTLVALTTLTAGTAVEAAAQAPLEAYFVDGTSLEPSITGDTFEIVLRGEPGAWVGLVGRPVIYDETGQHADFLLELYGEHPCFEPKEIDLTALPQSEPWPLNRELAAVSETTLWVDAEAINELIDLVYDNNTARPFLQPILWDPVAEEPADRPWNVNSYFWQGEQAPDPTAVIVERWRERLRAWETVNDTQFITDWAVQSVVKRVADSTAFAAYRDHPTLGRSEVENRQLREGVLLQPFALLREEPVSGDPATEDSGVVDIATINAVILQLGNKIDIVFDIGMPFRVGGLGYTQAGIIPVEPYIAVRSFGTFVMLPVKHSIGPMTAKILHNTQPYVIDAVSAGVGYVAVDITALFSSGDTIQVVELTTPAGTSDPLPYGWGTLVVP